MSNQLSLVTLPREALYSICTTFPIGSSELRSLMSTSTELCQVVTYCYQKNIQVIISGYNNMGTPIDRIIFNITPCNDLSELDTETIPAIHQSIIQVIQNHGIVCPNCPLALEDISKYNVEIQNFNLQKIWPKIREDMANAVDLPAIDAPAEKIRTWMNENQDLLQGITNLNLAYMALTCVPQEIGLITGLRRLDLHNNKLSCLPENLFANLSQLNMLYLNGNNLSQLPESLFANLSNLQGLYLNKNQLSQLPENIFANLSNLQELYLSFNQLSQLPENIFVNLSNLQELRLSYNQLSQLTENTFANLSNLKELYLHKNQLSYLPVNLFANLTQLKEVDLRANQLGQIPQYLFMNSPQVKVYRV